MRSREEIVELVAQETVWWAKQRLGKLRGEMHDTMSVNPFLIPILYELHHADGFADLGSLLLAGHLMTGHNTGFGKLMDEKILPRVFGTQKLDAKFRKSTPPYESSIFSDIDHIVTTDGKLYLVSLKAGRWTIQLGQAQNLNHSFKEIYSRHGEDYGGIVVGIIYGRPDEMTDKYDIAVGIQRTSSINHDLTTLGDYAVVKVGRDFWTWLNGGEPQTQGWIMEGILKGLRDANVRIEAKELLATYVDAFNRSYQTHVSEDGSVNWYEILEKING
jgi:hypothetical protein